MDSVINNLRAFGKFRLDAERKILWFENALVDLPLKEIELLCLLTESGGELITKEQILDSIWGDSFVEESNIARHIYRLRKTFEEFGESAELIQTVPRRGYRFTGEVINNHGDLVIERHSVTRTLIEEVEDSDKPEISQPARLESKVIPRKFLLVAGLVVLILAIGAGLYFYNLSKQSVITSQPTIKSVAVLPLRSLDKEENRALSMGFADTLITNLGRLDVTVLTMSTTSRYMNEEREPADIGKELGVDAVIDGTFQKSDQKLRIALRIIRASDGKQIWGETFDELENEIFQLQDSIATQTAKALSLNLNLSNRDAVLKRYTENVEAYQAYESGRYMHFQKEYPKAVKEFERALQYDSKYVLAYSGMADSYAFWANELESKEGRELYEKAKSYALQALVLDENLAEAHTSLGWIRRTYDWDWVEAEKHLHRAIELNPNSAVAHQRLAYLYITLGNTEEAVKLSEKAKHIDPVAYGTAWAFYCNRQYKESLEEYSRNLSLANSLETQKTPLLGKMIAYTGLKENKEAIRVFEESPSELKDDFALNSAYAIALYHGGDSNRAAKVLLFLEDKANEGDGRWVRLAYVYASMEKKDKAFTALKKGIETRDDRVMWIKTTPHFDVLRDDPRYTEFLQKMKLIY